MHSHPLGEGWQGMSFDDVRAERGHAGAVLGATRMPIIGLTLAGDGAWSGRFCIRTAPRTYARHNCATARVVGDRLSVHYMDELAPPPLANGAQIRTISAWGEEAQRDLARLRVGLVGAGSGGGLVGDNLARTGFEDVMLIDFDKTELHNLDRLSYATREDVGRFKVDTQAEHLRARPLTRSAQSRSMPPSSRKKASARRLIATYSFPALIAHGVGTSSISSPTRT
jgi:molybdopterin-synthase adenylyltransferase